MIFKSISIDDIMPQIVKGDNDFVVFMSGYLGRNIEGYDFPELLKEKEKKEIIKLLIPFVTNINVNNINVNNKIIDLTRVLEDDVALLGLIDREIIEDDILRTMTPQSTSTTRIISTDNYDIWFFLNLSEHFLVRSTTIGNGFENIYNKINDISILFDDNFVPIFNENYGFITSDLSLAGHGIKFKFLLNLWGLRSSQIFSSVLSTMASNGITYSHNPPYEKTNFMEFTYTFSPNKSMYENKKIFTSLLEKFHESEIEERKKQKLKVNYNNLSKEFRDMRESFKTITFMHYKALINTLSKLSMINFFSKEDPYSETDMDKMINYLLLLLRDTSIMLYSGISIPNDSIVGKERALLIKKFFTS